MDKLVRVGARICRRHCRHHHRRRCGYAIWMEITICTERMVALWPLNATIAKTLFKHSHLMLIYIYVHLMLIRLFRRQPSVEKFLHQNIYGKTTIFFGEEEREKTTIPLLKAGKLYGRHRMLSSSSSLYFILPFLLLLFLLAVSNKNASTNMFLSWFCWAGQTHH